MAFYTWQNHQCAFEKVPGQVETGASIGPALLLIHPIGVGLSRQFWQPFIEQWQQVSRSNNAIYSVDLLGCGQSDMPSKAYRPEDWAKQLAYFIEQIVEASVVLVVQGALLPVAVRLMDLSAGDSASDSADGSFDNLRGARACQRVKGLVLSGPPAWRLMTTPTENWKHQLAWRLFASPLGNLFYRYARREKFLASFSQKQLFETAADVTDDWLQMLDEGSQDMASRYAVFSFLAGFWRQDYAEAIARIQQPTLIVMGEAASTIDRTAAKEIEKVTDNPSQKRLQDYMDRFPRAKGVSIPGRNVLPYESTAEFVAAIAPFVAELSD